MFVYGVGDHLLDMLSWHPELNKNIERIFDKDQKKIGTRFDELDKIIESAELLSDVPAGTYIAIAAIRYFDEISADIQRINKGLHCLSIDDAYDMVLPPYHIEWLPIWGEPTDFTRDMAKRLCQERKDKRHAVVV